MRSIFLVILLLFSQVAFGQTPPPSNPNNFQLPTGFTFSPPASDAAVSYLQDIFGVVDGVLHGSGSQVLGTMFGVMNSAILSLAGVLVMYILVVSTLNTAHEGEVMGRDWSSIWIPIRSVVGIGLMIPKATGYSFIQIIVMWLVVQGIGTADSVWNSALNYFSRGGVLVQPAESLNQNTQYTVANVPLVTVAGNVLKSETCMYVLYNSLVNQQAASGSGSSVPDFTSSLLVTGTPSNLTPPCYAGDTRPGCSASGDSGGIISFPGNVSYAGKNYQGACGSVSWSFTNDETQNSNPANLGAYDSRSIAVQQIVLDEQASANALAQILLPTGGSQTPTDITTTNLNVSSLISAGLDYMGIMGPYLNEQQNAVSSETMNYFTTSAAYGWLSAGSYYFVLASINNAFTATETHFPSVTMPGSFSNSYFNSAAQDALNGNVTPTTVSCPGSYNNILDNYICSQYTSAYSQQTPPTPSAPFTVPKAGNVNMNWSVPVYPAALFTSNVPSIPGGKWLSSAINTIPNMFNGIATDLNNLTSAQTQGKGLTGDPIVQISSLGGKIIDDIEYLWIAGAIAMFATSLIGSICMGQSPVGNAINGFIMWFIPFLTAIMFTMFVAGAVMEYYVPLIPFILFLSAVIGWFIAVIESMVAAPLVALGLMIPDGHKHFGQAKNAFMLMLNVFMRPTLIIFGFITGAILSHVALWVLNQGLSTALGFENGYNIVSPDVTHILEIVALVVIYVGLVITIINKSFSLIYELPNNILSWIGGGVKSFGESQFGQEVKDQYQAAASQVSQQMQGMKLQDKAGELGTAAGEKLKGPSDSDATIQ